MIKARGFRLAFLAVLALGLVWFGGAAGLHLCANGLPGTLTAWQIPTPDSLPEGIAIDPSNGDVYFAQVGGDKIGKLDPATDWVTEWSAGDGPRYLVLGESGELYFTEMGGNKISRLIPSGDFYSSETVPTPGSQPTGIIHTTDGVPQIWFAEWTGDNVGLLELSGFVFDVVFPAARAERAVTPATTALSPTTTMVTPSVTSTWGSPPLPPAVMMIPGAASGPFTEWPLSLSEGHARMIAMGPGGDLWISTETAGIIQFAPDSNTFYFHNLPGGSASFDLAVDSAGYVWFTEGWEDKIGRLDPATGELWEWALRSGSQPFNLALSLTGDMVWFTEREGDRIGVLEPATDSITEYQLGADSHPMGITIDDHTGDVWFTTERSNAVGRLTTGPALGPPPTLFGSITLTEIMSTSLSSAKINGSDNASNLIPAGTILLYRTNEGRYGKLEIVSYGYDLTLRWLTYNADGSVYSQGDNLVVHGTWECDLDRGVEGSASADFWWEQVTGIERYLVPQKGARFAIYSAIPPAPGPSSGLPTVDLNIDRGCGANYYPGEPLTISLGVSETSSVTLFDFETSGNIKQTALGTVPGGTTRTITGVVSGPSGLETLVLVARTMSGTYISTGCSFGIGGVSPSLVSISLDRGCGGLYHYGETAVVTLHSAAMGRANLYNVTRDGRLAQLLANRLIMPGMDLNISAPIEARTGRSTLVLQVLSTGGQILTTSCSLDVVP